MGSYSDKSYVGMMHCFYCGDGYAVALDRRLHESLPRAAVYDMNPCPACASVMDSGGMIIIATTTSQEAMERQRQKAKKMWESKTLAFRRTHHFCFVPNVTRVGMIGINAESARRFSEATGGKVQPGTWTFVDKETWDLYFAEAAEEYEQSKKAAS
jgi:hypothetical protein